MALHAPGSPRGPLCVTSPPGNLHPLLLSLGLVASLTCPAVSQSCSRTGLPSTDTTARGRQEGKKSVVSSTLHVSHWEKKKKKEKQLKIIIIKKKKQRKGDGLSVHTDFLFASAGCNSSAGLEPALAPVTRHAEALGAPRFTAPRRAFPCRRDPTPRSSDAFSSTESPRRAEGTRSGASPSAAASGRREPRICGVPRRDQTLAPRGPYASRSARSHRPRGTPGPTRPPPPPRSLPPPGPRLPEKLSKAVGMYSVGYPLVV